MSIIADAGAVEGERAVTAHTTRAIASSWAFHRGISINDICNTVSRKVPTTFTSVYYKSVVGERALGAFAKAVLRKETCRPRPANTS